MLQQRKADHGVSAAYEDASLFAGSICQVSVELVPQMTRSERHDLRVRGFVNGHHEIEVLFAGRRTREVGPLETRLKALWHRACQTAEATKTAAPVIDKVRCPVRIEGAWRRKTTRDDSGWETHSYHIVAARWSLLDNEGQPVSFGEPPARPPRSIA
jgi:hypothetical protein